MNAFVLRAVVLAAVHVAVRALLGLAIGEWPLLGSPFRWISFAVVVIAAAVWGELDSRRDRADHPDPEDGADLTMRWLKAGLLGGILAGAAAWLLDKVPGFDLGDNSLFFELTSGAAWTVLLIFVAAMVGIGIGHLLAKRRATKQEKAAYSSTAPPAGLSSRATAE